jgi:hypothetical protein
MMGRVLGGLLECLALVSIIGVTMMVTVAFGG